MQPLIKWPHPLLGQHFHVRPLKKVAKRLRRVGPRQAGAGRHTRRLQPFRQILANGVRLACIRQTGQPQDEFIPAPPHGHPVALRRLEAFGGGFEVLVSNKTSIYEDGSSNDDSLHRGAGMGLNKDSAFRRATSSRF